MRTCLIVVIVILVAVAGYAYSKDPSGCMKIVHDFGVLFDSLSPVKVEIKNGAPAFVSTGDATDAAPEAVAANTPPAIPTPLPLPANNLLQNGDFSQGDAHWQGDGLTPRAYAAANHLVRLDPTMGQGLLVPLNPRAWTRIYQTFPTDTRTVYSILVNYRLSPDMVFSKDPADYTEISKRIDIPGFDRFRSIGIQPGEFYGTVGDPTATSISMEVYWPGRLSRDVRSYRHTYPAVGASASKTFALAFPPGTGTVVKVSAAVTSN